MLGLPIIFIICLILLLCYLYVSTSKKLENFPPGPPKLPIWGTYWYHTLESRFLHLAFESLGKKYKTDILGVYFGDFPTIVTMTNELCKEVLTREEFVGRVETVTVRTRSNGDPKGIFFTDGPLWKAHRRFSLRHLRDYGFGRRSDVMENYTTDEIKYIINFLNTEPEEEDKEVCKGKGHVLMPDFLFGALINTVMSALSSTQFEHHEVRKYARAAFNFLKSVDASGGAIVITPWLKYVAPDYFGHTSTIRDNGILMKFMKEIVDEHLNTFSDDHHRDFIDAYISENIKQGTELDYDQLMLITIDYMFPSPIGIGHTLNIFCGFLINNPDIQIKIQNEIDRVVGRTRLPNLDDRKNLHYFEATLREVIRIIPLTPLGLPRRCVQDTTLRGYTIPKDTIIIANMWTAHRDKSVFQNPNSFQPERFLDEDGNLMKKDTTIGFGAGKRLCAGETYARQTMFLIMTALLQNFTIKSPDGKSVDLDDLSPGIVLSLKEQWIMTVPR